MRAARLGVLLAVLLHHCATVTPSHYDTLKVPRSASATDIRAAYKSAALRHHPDKHLHRNKASEQRKFEAANEAFSVLSDPTRRCQYDLTLDFGGHAMPPRSRSQYPVLRMSVPCTLAELGGWRPAPIHVASILPLRLAARLPLPLRLNLPPGSRAGDVLRLPLPSIGIELELVLCDVGFERCLRHGDDLLMEVPLPAWHNIRPGKRPVRVPTVCGSWVEVCARGHVARAPRGEPEPERVLIKGMGMPHRSRDPTATPASCERGDLVVTLRRRTVADSAGRLALRAGVAAVAARGVVRELRELRRLNALRHELREEQRQARERARGGETPPSRAAAPAGRPKARARFGGVRGSKGGTG